MATILEYFNNDFKDLSLDKTLNFTVQKIVSSQVAEEEKIEVIERIKQDSNSNVRLFTYYIPSSRGNTLGLIVEVINQIENQITAANDLIAMMGFTGDKNFGNHKPTYANTIYFYTEDLLNDEEINKLDEFCKSKGYFVTVRSTDYTTKRMELEKPVAFISHDSRDKDLIARKLAESLSSRLCTVWYDEYSLKIGDSLRESIESGIKEAKKCVLILTKHFLDNPGWGKKEFNSIFTREMIMNEKIVLPIWFGVTKEEVYNYSPSLADTFALTWPSPEGKTEEKYKQEVEILISKIHTAITI